MKSIDLVAKIIYSRNIINLDGTPRLDIPSYIYGNDRNADDIFLIMLETQIDSIPRHLGIVLDRTTKQDSLILKKFMESAIVDKCPEDMFGKTIRIIAEDTSEKLIPLVVGYASLDKCYILNDDTFIVKSFKFAKALIS